MDVGFVTHGEYEEILRRIEEFWEVTDSPQRRTMMRLIVVLSFRLGVRAGEIQALRIGNLLLRDAPELLLWPWKGERFKKKNARRRLPLRKLETEQTRELVTLQKEIPV